VPNIAFHADAFKELRLWAGIDKKLHLKILDLLDDAARSPFTGLGKPEPLKGDWQGYWSRRINDEHRLIDFFQKYVLTIPSPACRIASSTLSHWERDGVRALLKEV